MHDEFEYPRPRVEAHPGMADYLASRTDEQLAALIYDETYRRNVFGSYPGLSGDHSMAIIAEARRRERERCAKIAKDDKAPYHGKHHSAARETAIAIGKRGVVMQQDGTNVVHVYGEKWLPAPAQQQEGDDQA